MSQSDHDMMTGAAEIAEFIGSNERRAFYLLEKRLIPGFKIGERWHARIYVERALR